MARLIILRGPELGQHFQLRDGRNTLGRQVDCAICLNSKQVSRQHAQVTMQTGEHFLEDLGSSNGTYLNGKRLPAHSPSPLHERDMVQIGPYVFGLRSNDSTPPTQAEPALIVRETLSALSLPPEVLNQDAATKLHVVLEIAQHLARTLDLEPMLDKLLEQLMKLFPHADRSQVILLEEDNRLIVRAQKSRKDQHVPYTFSRTIVRRALEEGIGLISGDVLNDVRFQTSHTITMLEIHSVLCARLINPEGQRLGVIQVDRTCKGYGFRTEDLQLLTAVGMQVSVVLENVSLHAERLREERLVQELTLAREIQQSYLPEELEGFDNADFEIFGQVFPARLVAGDFYDFFKLPDGRLCFFIGDVSGKGMPAALFLVAVRTLCRHLAKESTSPVHLLTRLNEALAADNPSCLFVTLVHGTYDPQTGETTMTSAGHPSPHLRRASGTLEPIGLKSGRLLGYGGGKLNLREVKIQLDPGDLLMFYTDGLFEARSRTDRVMYGFARTEQLALAFNSERSLADCSEAVKGAIDHFTDSQELQDDLTLLFLRRFEK